jgi:hypothetical protein
MHFQQVALALLAFSSTRGASIQSSLQRLTVVPPLGTPRIVVEQDIRDPSAWQVRVVARLEPPIYLPPVTTQQGLQDALERAWQLRRPSGHNAPFLTRFLEPPPSSAPLRSSPPTSWPPPASSPPRSASHPRQQTDSA